MCVNAYSISQIAYTVNLYNKTTGLLHRRLFQDTIRDKDSIETESLRGFYIYDVPNGEDSFYVKLEVDDNFDNADYFINPIYEDNQEEEDFGGQRLAVIFEKGKQLNNNISGLPTETTCRRIFLIRET